jgi:hypothetical protein
LQSYRVYGAGQAKLAFLKAQEIEGDLPPFMDEAALHEIANEHIWQEFLDIDVGHWANSNLRKLAMECGAKDLYDKYYDWASTYAHSHWGELAWRFRTRRQVENCCKFRPRKEQFR